MAVNSTNPIERMLDGEMRVLRVTSGDFIGAVVGFIFGRSTGWTR